MRNFRTAAVAAATAVTVAFSGTAIASAQSAEGEQTTQSSTQEQGQDQSSQQGDQSSKDDQPADPDAPKEDKSSTGEGTASSKFGAATGAYDQPTVKGTDLFGSSINEEATPQWAEIWREGTYALVGTAVVSALIGAYNFAVHQGIIPNHILDGVFGIK